MLDFEAEETERPQFRGTYLETDNNTTTTGNGNGIGSGNGSIGGHHHEGEQRKAYPLWRRLLRYAVSLPVVMLALAVILVVMGTVFTTQVPPPHHPTAHIPPTPTTHTTHTHDIHTTYMHTYMHTYTEMSTVFTTHVT